jgi:hypothetical protein
VRGITAGLGALQRGKQRGGAALAQAAGEWGGVVDLVKLARTDGLLDVGNGGVKTSAVGAAGPLDLRGGIGVNSSIGRPGQRCVVHGKPRQRAVGGMGLQGGVKGRCGFVAHMADAPVAALCGGMHGVEHGAHVLQLVGLQLLARGAKGLAQARRAAVVRVGKVNVRSKGQIGLQRLWDMR